MKVPYIKAIDKDTGKEVQGFYFEYPETSYCFTEDYEKSPVEMIPCVVFYTMTDWGLPNKPMLCQNIDKDSIKLITKAPFFRPVPPQFAVPEGKGC